jgi:hypothetical protein
MVWHYERVGYSQCAYILGSMLQYKIHNEATSSSANGDRKLWRGISNAQVPPKVKLFAWRVANACLPTRLNKFKRHLEKAATCELCGTEDEFEFHALIMCPQAHNLREPMRGSWELLEENSLLVVLQIGYF